MIKLVIEAQMWSSVACYVLGVAIVAAVIALVVAIVKLQRALSSGGITIAAAPAAAPAAPAMPAAVPSPATPVANISSGELKLCGVPEKTAALVMAIVADSVKKPLGELRFISIREVN